MSGYCFPRYCQRLSEDEKSSQDFPKKFWERGPRSRRKLIPDHSCDPHHKDLYQTLGIYTTCVPRYHNEVIPICCLSKSVSSNDINITKQKTAVIMTRNHTILNVLRINLISISSSIVTPEKFARWDNNHVNKRWWCRWWFNELSR